MMERHILELDYLAFEVAVEDDGSVGCWLRPLDKDVPPELRLGVAELAAIVAFAETHGQVTVGAEA